jgi:hypothetical protein
MITPPDIKHLFTKTKGSDYKYRAVCPLHGKTDLNLSVFVRKDGTLGFSCFSHGCDRKEIIEALGLSLVDILPHRAPEQIKKHRNLANQTRLKKDLEHEILILLLWLSDTYQNIFPCCSTDSKRVIAALSKVQGLTGYFLRRAYDEERL